jgi:hypothetical protein
MPARKPPPSIAETLALLERIRQLSPAHHAELVALIHREFVKARRAAQAGKGNDGA